MTEKSFNQDPTPEEEGEQVETDKPEDDQSSPQDEQSEADQESR